MGQWPQNIDSLVAKCKITVCYEDKSLDQIHVWNRREFVLSAQYHSLKFPLAKQYPSSISVDIMISEVWSNDDGWVSINHSAWNKYGIIMND